MCVEHQALEKLKNGQMSAAHQIVQELDSKTACWIHAVIHKVEGDLGNSRYWYSRAGVEFSNLSLLDEIEKIRVELDL